MMYRYTLSLTSALGGDWWSEPRRHCVVGCVGPKAGLDGCGKFRSPPAPSESLYRLSYPGPHNCLSRNVTVTEAYKFVILYMIRPSSATTYSTALCIVLSNQLAVTLDGLRHLLF